MSVLELLLWPSLACLVLTGIHAYLGLHVVERGVIFVDLALAQIAALGTVIAFLAGFELHDRPAYFFSLGFTLLGAAIFALLRSRNSKNQEAFIGVVYVVSAALAILIMDRSPEGSEHVKYILVGNLLGTGQADVVKMTLVYAGIGVLHWMWRKPFFLITTEPERAEGEIRVRLWDFLFYASFGAVVTSSVMLAGVLLVFSYLTIPAIAAMMYCRGIKERLVMGWSIGALVSFIGMAVSYTFDTPTAATIICVFGVSLAILAGIRPLFAPRPSSRGPI